MIEEIKGDKVFVEKGEKIRLIIDHRIGLIKVLDQLKKRFRVSVFNNRVEDEIILLIEKNGDEKSKVVKY